MTVNIPSIKSTRQEGTPPDTHFLHVLEGVDANGTPLAVSSITALSGTAFYRAVVGTTSLMFIHGVHASGNGRRCSDCRRAWSASLLNPPLIL
jgi:hypothetical protein